MKLILLSIALTVSFLESFGQTSMEECKIILEGDLQTLLNQGYDIKNISEVSGYCEKDKERYVGVQELYRPKDKVPCAAIITYLFNGKGAKFCIPVSNSSNEVLAYACDDWWKTTAGREYMTRPVCYSLAKYNAYLLNRLSLK